LTLITLYGIILKVMREKKGFISWKDAGPRKMVDGIEVAPDRVKVYFNLNLDCLSVIDAETGLLYCHAHRVELRTAKFRVQPAGRERVLREKRKNVHAYIIGDCYGIGDVSKERFRLVDNELFEKYSICDCGDKPYDYCEECVPESGDEFRTGYYSPYKHKTFVDELNRTPLHKSSRVIIRDKTAIGPHYNIFYVPEPKKKRESWNKGMKYTHRGLRARKLSQV
jgi:hypothetical protein